MAKKKQVGSSEAGPVGVNTAQTPPKAAKSIRQDIYARPAGAAAVSGGKVSSADSLPIENRAVAWWPPAVLALIGFAIYINTFGHGYVLDDLAAITQNLFVQEGLKGIPKLLKVEFWHFSNISLGYYRPLSLITFAIEQEYFKSNPAVSHLVNTVLYSLTGLVLGILLQKWLPNQMPGRTLIALAIGLLFITHPIHTEVVANIKSRDEIMSFLFISSTLLLYWRYLETKHLGWIGGAAVTAYLAFLSKETSIVMLALLPAMQYYHTRRSLWQSLISLWPFLLVAFLFFVQKAKMIGTLTGRPPADWANYPYAMEKTQGLTTFKFFAYYLKLLFLPHPLVYDYSFNVIPSGQAGDALVWLGFGLFIGLVWLAWLGFRRRTLWGFGLFWFFVTMTPALGFIFSRGGILAERFLYAPVLGFAIVVVWGLQQLLSKQPQAETSNPAFTQYAFWLALVVVTAGLYSFKTVTRNPAWKDNFTLFTTDIENSPNSCQVHRHVANEWIEKGLRAQDTSSKNKYAKLALHHLRESTRIYPTFGETYFSMGYVYQRIMPVRDSAVHYYKQAIRAANNYAPAYNNLGVIYESERRYQLASYYYNQSMLVNPAYVDGQRNWRILKQATGIDVKVLPDSVLARN